MDFPLKKYGSEILKYDGTPIAKQSLHEAVYNIDTGEKTCNNADRLFGYMQNFFGNRTEETNCFSFYQRRFSKMV